MPKSRDSLNVQCPPLGPFSFQDIPWSPTTRKGWGNASAIVHAFIPYDRVEDFIQGQTCEDGSSIGWNVKDKKK